MLRGRFHDRSFESWACHLVLVVDGRVMNTAESQQAGSRKIGIIYQVLWRIFLDTRRRGWVKKFPVASDAGRVQALGVWATAEPG